MKKNKRQPGKVILLTLMSCALSPMLEVLISGEAYAALVLDNLSNSYSSCGFRDNGNDTSTVSIIIDYKESAGHVGHSYFNSRGILIYAYDKNGKPILNSRPASAVTMNGVKTAYVYEGSGYAMYHGGGGAWDNRGAFIATVTATLNNKAISAWPAVAIRAGNFTQNDDVGEINGAAYIAKDNSGDGFCRVITSPGTPPPLDISISVSAPDWDLGDLQQGDSDTTFGRTDQQLCFSYSAADVQGQRFIISASNANGVVNNRYQLRHLSDTSQAVPYSLMLDSGGSRLQLPNNSTALQLDGGNRTCFVPTFRTEVGKAVKDGDYSDVLTFTVTTKS